MNGTIVGVFDGGQRLVGVCTVQVRFSRRARWISPIDVTGGDGERVVAGSTKDEDGVTEVWVRKGGLDRGRIGKELLGH